MLRVAVTEITVLCGTCTNEHKLQIIPVCYMCAITEHSISHENISGFGLFSEYLCLLFALPVYACLPCSRLLPATVPVRDRVCCSSNLYSDLCSSSCYRHKEALLFFSTGSCHRPRGVVDVGPTPCGSSLYLLTPP